MTPPFRLGIQQFIGHYREQGAAIARVESELHRKLLYCAALDPLARAIAAPGTENRARFVNLLMHHVGWEDAGRVSLPQLMYQLKLKKRTRFRLYREARRWLENSPPRRRLPLSASPTFSEITKYAHPDELGAVRRHTYAELFYTFRNNLVHEYREPGYGTDWWRNAALPFYTNQSSFSERELVYPIAFVAGIYERALDSASDYMLKNRINPHSKFNFGSHWRAT